MFWYQLKTAFILAVASVILVGCGDKNSGNPTGPAGIKMNDYLVSYKIAGSKLIMESQMTDKAHNYCNGSVLVHTNDTTYTSIDTFEFNLNGDTLTLLFFPETLSFSKSIIVHSEQLIRKGSGTGIVGVWANAMIGYRVVSGVLTASEQKELDLNNPYQTFGITYEYELTPTQYFRYISGEYDYAALFIYYWNLTYYDVTTSYYPDSANVTVSYPSDSARYDVTVKRISSKMVTLTGNKNNEVVTVNWDILSGGIEYYNDEYAEIYTSSNKEHTTYTYYSDPVSCPNDLSPSWYDSFCKANAKKDNSSVAKKVIGFNRHTVSDRNLMEIFRKPLNPF